MDKFLDVGFGFRVAMNEIYGMVPVKSFSTVALKKEFKRNRDIINACMGRKENTLILLNNGKAFLSALTTETLCNNCREDKLLEREGVDIGTTTELS